jgi:hypothetical protein
VVAIDEQKIQFRGAKFLSDLGKGKSAVRIASDDVKSLAASQERVVDQLASAAKVAAIQIEAHYSSVGVGKTAQQEQGSSQIAADL